MLDPVSPGAPLRISALDTSTIHAFVKRGLVGNQNQVAPGFAPAGQSSVLILVQNDTEADLAQFDAVGLDDAIFTDYTSEGFLQTPMISAVAEDVSKPLAVVQEPIAAGKIGVACLMGLTVAKMSSSCLWRSRLVFNAGTLGYFILGECPMVGLVTATALRAGLSLAWNYTLKPCKPAADASEWPPFVAVDTDSLIATNPAEWNNPVDATTGGMTGTGVEVSADEPACPMVPLAGFVQVWSYVLGDGTVAYYCSPFPNSFWGE